PNSPCAARRTKPSKSGVPPMDTSQYFSIKSWTIRKPPWSSLTGMQPRGRARGGHGQRLAVTAYAGEGRGSFAGAGETHAVPGGGPPCRRGGRTWAERPENCWRLPRETTREGDRNHWQGSMCTAPWNTRGNSWNGRPLNGRGPSGSPAAWIGSLKR